MKSMTKMENVVINMTHCDRMTANLVANAVLEIDRCDNRDDPAEAESSERETTPVRFVPVNHT